MSINSKSTVVSMFSGCGGFDLGLKKAGYDILWANDIDKDCVTTYKKNIGNEIVLGDIRDIEVPKLNNVDLLVAGFPCQPFSNAGSRLGLEDDRGNLYKDTYRFIKELQPKAIVYENVRGLLSFKSQDGKGKFIDQLVADIENLGYYTSFRLLNFSHFGVPQNRIRVLLIAVKDKNYLGHIFPEVVAGKDLSIMKTLEGLDDNVPNQTEIMRLNPQALYYGSLIKEGGSWKDIPYDDLPERWKRIRDDMPRYHYPKFFRKYGRNDISGTITAAFKPENAAVFHPIEGRIFSVREIARIQTFPDDFIFEGTTVKSKYKQIGNAVPPLMAELVGKQLLHYFNDVDTRHIVRTEIESDKLNVNKPIVEQKFKRLIQNHTRGLAEKFFSLS